MKFTPLSSASAFLSRNRRQRYESIPDNENEENNAEAEANREAEDTENRSLLHTKLWTLQINKHRKLTGLLLFFVTVAVAFWVSTLIYIRLPSASCDTVQHGYKCQPTISQYWGQYSPYYSVPSSISDALPPTCTLTFASILSRHGARDPTLGKSLKYASLIARIQSDAASYAKETSFLKTFSYDLGADQLSLFGQQQMINSGIKFYDRYTSLAAKNTPFVRASGQTRVIESAQNFTQGFHNSKMDDETADGQEDFPYNILVIPETDGTNNTLDYTLCTNFLDGPNLGAEAMSKFGETFLPAIIDRFNTQIPGVNFTNDDIISLMDLCPFHTVSSPTGQVSPFCALFPLKEWKNYDYLQSLGKHYSFSWGAPLGPTQGVGWTNELIARLTSKPVQDHTSTNSTLDGVEETFPLKGKLYADFSHDNDMVGIFAALGLYNATKPMDDGKRVDREEMGGWSAAWTVPFAGRVYVEKMVCGGDGLRDEVWTGDEAGLRNEAGLGNEAGDQEPSKELIRIIVNDRVIPLQNCNADALGRCELDAFVESLGFARGGGDWERCFD